MRLTKNSPWSIVTGETGFTHARTAHSQPPIPNPNVCCLLGLLLMSNGLQGQRLRFRISSSRLDLPIVDNESCNFFYSNARDTVSIAHSSLGLLFEPKSHSVLEDEGAGSMQRRSAYPPWWWLEVRKRSGKRARCDLRKA